MSYSALPIQSPEKVCDLQSGWGKWEKSGKFFQAGEGKHMNEM